MYAKYRDIYMRYNTLQSVTREEAHNIIESRLPLGKFVFKDNDTYIGIDNESGDAWVEEFKTMEDLIYWQFFYNDDAFEYDSNERALVSIAG